MVTKKKTKGRVAPVKIVRRSPENKEIAVFIDGVLLDRASKRLAKKIDLANLVKDVCAGRPHKIARYYTLLPQEDDSRHRAFLDAVNRAGLDVFTKRLPPKGIQRQVSLDVEIASDILSFVLGREDAATASLISASGQFSILPSRASQIRGEGKARNPLSPQPLQEISQTGDTESEEIKTNSPENKLVIVVCASKEISYALHLARYLGADTLNADFGQFVGRDVLKSASKWLDLTFSTKIWKDPS